MSIDNGSDKELPSNSTNFVIPWNIRLSGQARIGLIYLKDYFPADYYFIVTTSAELDEKINYREIIEHDIQKLESQYNIGIIYSSLIINKDLFTGDEDRVKNQIKNNNRSGFIQIFKPRTVSFVISNELVQKAYEKSIGFFNIDLYRGHGMNLELLYWSRKLEYLNVVDYNFWIKWNEKITYKKNVGGESPERYAEKGNEEKTKILKQRYGRNWRAKFYKMFKKEIKKEIPYEGYKGIYGALKSYDTIVPNDIIVVENELDQYAYFGELNANLAIRSGATAAIIGGKTRDSKEVKKLSFPIFSKCTTCIDVKNRATLESINKLVTIDNVSVYPDDLIFGDNDGVVVIPKIIQDKVISRAFEIINKEKIILTDIANGIMIQDIIDKQGYF